MSEPIDRPAERNRITLMHKHPLFLLLTPDVNNVQHAFIVPSATSLLEARVLICTTILRIPACCGVKKEDEVSFSLKRLHSVILASTGAKDLIELADGLYEAWHNRVQKANLSSQSPPMSENGGAPEVEQ